MGPSTRIKRTNLGYRGQRLFERLGAKTLGEAAEFTMAQLCGEKGVGETTVNEIVILLGRAKLELTQSARNHDGFHPLKQIFIDDVQSLSQSCREHLRQAGVRTLYGLTQRTKEQLKMDGVVGEAYFGEVEELMKVHGLELKPSKLAIPIAELELSVRSRKALQRMGVTNLGELIELSGAEIKAGKNVGETSIAEIKRQLARYGLTLKAESEPEPEGDRYVSPQNPNLDDPIESLNLSARALSCLESTGTYELLRDLANATGEELLKIRSFGRTSLHEVRRKLAERGLSIGCLRKWEGMIPVKRGKKAPVEPIPAHRADLKSFFGEQPESPDETEASVDPTLAHREWILRTFGPPPKPNQQDERILQQYRLQALRLMDIERLLKSLHDRLDKIDKSTTQISFDEEATAEALAQFAIKRGVPVPQGKRTVRVEGDFRSGEPICVALEVDPC